MPDWEEINRRLREEEKSLSETAKLTGDSTPNEERRSEKCDRLQREREAEEKTRSNEPGMLKIGFTLTWKQIANFFKPKKNENTNPNNIDDPDADD